jgi:hypothetical protein
MLSREAMNAIEALSAPLERSQRESFVNTCVQKIEEAAASEVGVGYVHRVAAATQRAFFDLPIYGSAGGSHEASSELAV